jgi:tripartite-type tricarboxylate transporter receptor subunit TctC
MTSIHRRNFCLAFASLGLSTQTRAQAFPTRPIDLIVPFAPGGLVDIIGRMAAEPFGKELGQPVVVRNVPGAGGNIAYSRLAKSPADGYTLGMVGGGLYINTVLRPGGFDAVNSFHPIGFLGAQPFVLFVNPGRLNVSTLAEALERIRKEPGKYSYSSGGVGAPSHVIMEYLKAAHSLKVLHVPYTGQGPAINALMAGNVDMTLQTLAGAEELIRTGRLRPIAVTGLARIKLFPEIPTFDEAGLKGVEVVAWSGLVAPSALPQPHATRLIRAWEAAMADPKLQQSLQARAVEVTQMNDQEFARLMLKDNAFWERALTIGNVKTV